MKKYTKKVEAFGRHLKQLRKTHGFTQETLADECEIDRVTIARIETGTLTPTLHILFALADALNVKVKDLFDY